MSSGPHGPIVMMMIVKMSADIWWSKHNSAHNSDNCVFLMNFRSLLLKPNTAQQHTFTARTSHGMVHIVSA